MDERKLKIRLGLILQELLGLALKKTSKYKEFESTPKHDANSMVPDFIIPSSEDPKFFIEVTQTETRDSFRMKTLRYCQSVLTNKSTLGFGTKSVNVLFGNPGLEIPQKNVEALCSLFDLSLNPQSSSGKISAASKELEKVAYEYASSEKVGDVAYAVESISKKQTSNIEILAKAIEGVLDSKPNGLFSWSIKKNKVDSFKELEFYPMIKKCLLASMCLSDSDLRKFFNNKCDKSSYSVLSHFGFTESRKSLKGEINVLTSKMKQFIGLGSVGISYDSLCRKELATNSDTTHLIEDLRSSDRRMDMIERFLAVKGDRKRLKDLIIRQLSDVSNIEHSRAWAAEMMAIYSRKSQNEYNRYMVQNSLDPENYQYPYNHITGKFERLINSPQHFDVYVQNSVNVFNHFIAKDGTLEDAALESEFIRLRVDGLSKLQKFNPLHIVVIDTLNRNGYLTELSHEPSLIYDLSGGKGRAGKFNVIRAQKDNRILLVNALYVDDYGGLDKAKEWAARGVALSYRFSNESLVKKSIERVFVLDGPWHKESQRKLDEAGWTICRVNGLNAIL